MRVIFDVTGNGIFPWDMLRYDECFPYSPEEAAKFQGLDDEDRECTIRLATYSPDTAVRPSARRWATFGWTVTIVNVE